MSRVVDVGYCLSRWSGGRVVGWSGGRVWVCRCWPFARWVLEMILVHRCAVHATVVGQKRMSPGDGLQVMFSK